MDDSWTGLLGREVGGWPGVTVGETSRGGRAFFYGRVELGHLHGTSVVDLPFPKKIRDGLIAQGLASVHPPLPDSGWVRKEMVGAGDMEGAVELFLMNYRRARDREERRGA